MLIPPYSSSPQPSFGMKDAERQLRKKFSKTSLEQGYNLYQNMRVGKGGTGLENVQNPSDDQITAAMNAFAIGFNGLKDRFVPQDIQNFAKHYQNHRTSQQESMQERDIVDLTQRPLTSTKAPDGDAMEGVEQQSAARRSSKQIPLERANSEYAIKMASTDRMDTDSELSSLPSIRTSPFGNRTAESDPESHVPVRQRKLGGIRQTRRVVESEGSADEAPASSTRRKATRQSPAAVPGAAASSSAVGTTRLNSLSSERHFTNGKLNNEGNELIKSLPNSDLLALRDGYKTDDNDDRIIRQNHLVGTIRKNLSPLTLRKRQKEKLSSKLASEMRERELVSKWTSTNVKIPKRSDT